ncbi:MAG TPA: ABC transporter ATP-binding protein [Candidatus Binatia bacterium]|nr:ABC transporter ATP-binding protein [Candidatus Binatia bacterium]
MTAVDALVAVERVDVAFARGGPALQGVTLRVAAGELVSVVGPSGCGKSTLLRVVAGLIPPSAGTVAVADRAAAIAMVFQQPALLPWRTVLRNVALPLELDGVRGPEGRARAAAMLAQVGLAAFADAYPAELSGGMRMRAAVARALVTRPRLLLMDEPFAAADEITRQRLHEELLGLRAAVGFTTLFVTHNVFEAVFLADRVVVLSARPGRVTAEVAVPLGRPRPPEVRGDAAFARLVGEVARALRAGGA